MEYLLSIVIPTYIQRFGRYYQSYFRFSTVLVKSVDNPFKVLDYLLVYFIDLNRIFYSQYDSTVVIYVRWAFGQRRIGIASLMLILFDVETHSSHQIMHNLHTVQDLPKLLTQ